MTDSQTIIDTHREWFKSQAHARILDSTGGAVATVRVEVFVDLVRRRSGLVGAATVAAIPEAGVVATLAVAATGGTVIAEGLLWPPVLSYLYDRYI